MTYDLLLSTNIPDSPEMMVIKSDQTIGLVFNITSTNPMTNMEFEISEIEGHVDAFHFGTPVVHFGAAYEFSNPQERILHMSVKESSTGLAIQHRRWRILGLLNTESTRDWENEDNIVKRILGNILLISRFPFRLLLLFLLLLRHL